jgi:hypothetical protein
MFEMFGMFGKKLPPKKEELPPLPKEKLWNGGERNNIPTSPEAMEMPDEKEVLPLDVLLATLPDPEPKLLQDKIKEERERLRKERLEADLANIRDINENYIRDVQKKMGVKPKDQPELPANNRLHSEDFPGWDPDIGQKSKK